MMSFFTEGQVAGNVLKEWPATQAWYNRISSRPAWKKAETRGGKNDLTLITK